VLAGNDVFPRGLMESYLRRYWEGLGLTQDEFLALGTLGSDSHDFNMTVLGLRMADRRNGVSHLHASVCRNMWHGVWPELKEEEVPILSVTNGVHTATWMSAPMQALLDQHLGAEKYERTGDRTGQRNGHRERPWDTRVGTVELQVPRVRVRELVTVQAPGGVDHVAGVGLVDLGCIVVRCHGMSPFFG
jgi:glucan phosphorylase